MISYPDVYSVLRQVCLSVVLLLSNMTFAQQTLNLDFEKLSVEGVNRPWAWTVYAYAPNTKYVCDSITTFSGNYSLKISNDKSGDSSRFELTHFIEPSQILKKSLTLKGWMKSTDFSGEAGIMIQTVGSRNDEYVILQEEILFIGKNSSEGWDEYETGFEIDSSSHSILVTTFFTGSGTVWIDNMKIAVNGEWTNHVPVAPSFTARQQQWINENSIPFLTTKPTFNSSFNKESFVDLDYFKTMTGDARIIALGESTHGTSEFFKVKHRLLQYAVSELNVRVFVLEDNQLLVERINNFVVNGIGKAEEVIKGLFAVWNTQEMLDMIKWLRSYNEQNPSKKVEFVGMDIQNPSLALDHLDKFLAKYDPVLQVSSSKRLEDFKQNWRTGYYKDDSSLHQWNDDSRQVYESVLMRKTDWLKNAANHNDSIEIEWAIQNARLIHQSTSSILTGGFEGRDKAMAENIRWIANRYPDSRVLVWAHDSSY